MEFTHKKTNKCIKEIPKSKVKFAKEYRNFIKEFGSEGICGTEIIGVEDNVYASVVEETG